MRMQWPRRRWLTLAACLLLGGAVAAFTQRDRERRRADPDAMERLAAVSIPESSDTPSSDWPQWRGPHRDGLSPETGLAAAWPAGGPRRLWARPLGRGFSSVAVAAGQLHTMDQEESPAGIQEAVVCLDAATGKELWRFGYPNHFTERFGNGPRSTPAVDGDLVYAVGPTGIFHCLRAVDGSQVWRHDLMEEFHGRPMQYGVSFSPLVEGDLVVALPGGPDGNSVTAFEKHTGRLAWKALDDAVGYSSPIAVTAAGVRQIVVLTNEALVGLSPRDGAELWRFPWKTDGGFNIATPVSFGDYVFVSSAYGKGCALVEIIRKPDGTLGARRVYEHNRMRNYFASSVRVGESLYGFDMTDLACMDLRRGKILWRQRGPRTFGKGSLLAADGKLIVLGEDGRLALADASPAGYHERAAADVSAHKCWTTPALAAGRLYVRDESSLTCFDLKESLATSVP